jgi:hypothetical protein
MPGLKIKFLKKSLCMLLVVIILDGYLIKLLIFCRAI